MTIPAKKKILVMLIYVLSLHQARVSDLSGPWTLRQKGGIHEWGQDEVFLWGPCLLIPILMAVGSQRAWRQPRGEWPLLPDSLLQGLAVNIASR